MEETKPVNLSKKRKDGILERQTEALLYFIEENEASYQLYVKLYRMVYHVDPDTTEVTNEWLIAEEEEE